MSGSTDDHAHDGIDWQRESMDGMELSLRELSRLCDVHAEHLLEFVEHGVIEPRTGSGPLDWRFDAVELRRGRTALRLQRELRVNLAGAALALDLLEELRAARSRIRTLERLLRP